MVAAPEPGDRIAFQPTQRAEALVQTGMMRVALSQPVHFLGALLDLSGQVVAEPPEARRRVRSHRAGRAPGVNSSGVAPPARNSAAASRAMARRSSREASNC